MASGHGINTPSNKADLCRTMAFVFSVKFPIKRSYRIGEIAEALGVHFSTVRRWADEGKIECIRLGTQRRISYESLKSFVENSRA